MSDLATVLDPEKKARGGITCFAVDLKSPGVILERQWPTMMGEAPWQILFENVRGPSANVIGPIGGGFSLAQKWVGEGRIRGHGARPVGIARRALDMMIEYSKVRDVRPAAGRSPSDPVHDRRTRRWSCMRCATWSTNVPGA